MNGCAIALMAKAPLPGAAKTRLAPTLGDAGAAALAQRLLAHAVEQALAAGLGPVVVWAAPDAAHPSFVRAQQLGAALAVQGAGNLGARMAQVFERHFAALAAPLLLMGADAPALDAAMLQRAAVTLQGHDAVFVPAHDGGYALIGLRAAPPALLAALFSGMNWSTPRVMTDTRQRLAAAGFSHAELPAVHDIDEPSDLAHLPPHLKPHLPSPLQPAAPGRSCPLHYRYAPSVFAQATPLRCEVLYVVGGLYGNEPALDQVLALFEQESGEKQLIFNGDFNWFNTDPAAFERLNTRVLAHTALRGNVETELAADETSAGCGCAYPHWVGDGVVERSNRILQRLRDTARGFPRLTQGLGALPMWARADVAGLRVGIVHGDAQSLAGWGFAQEHLHSAAHRSTVRQWFEQAQVDAFACSHTCLPVFQALPMAGRAIDPLVLNNGATGMPNFRGDSAGLLTRIAVRPFAGAPALRRHGLRAGEAFVDALAVDSATPAWRTQFLEQWPPGSDAHESYWARISDGPDHAPAQALRVSSEG